MQFRYTFFQKVTLPDDDGDPTGREITFDYADMNNFSLKNKGIAVEINSGWNKTLLL